MGLTDTLNKIHKTRTYFGFWPTYDSQWRKDGTGYVQYMGTSLKPVRTSGTRCECGNPVRLCHPEA